MNSINNYTYSIDECDIQDKVKGEKFRHKRAQWIECLMGKDVHSIFQQIYKILSDYALFQVVLDLRKIAQEQPEKGVGFNWPVIRLFSLGYAITQATAIRRLIDKGKDVTSLQSVFKDIKNNIGLITRENYICYDGLPYDYNAANQKYLSKNFDNNVDGYVGFIPSTGPEAWATSRLCHIKFDKLVQVTAENRKRSDLISVEIIKYLEDQISQCNNVKKYVDKYIAHAATPESRSELTEEQKKFNLDKLETCIKIIYQVASIIGNQLLCESTPGGIPVPQYNHLENLDKSWVSPENIEKARKKWHKVYDEVSEWNSNSLWPPDITK